MEHSWQFLRGHQQQYFGYLEALVNCLPVAKPKELGQFDLSDLDDQER